MIHSIIFIIQIIIWETVKAKACYKRQTFQSWADLDRLMTCSCSQFRRILNIQWQRDYQGLFDFQSKEVHRHLYTTNKNCFLTYDRQSKKTMFLTLNEITEQVSSNIVFEIQKTPNFYKIIPYYKDIQQITSTQVLWLIVKSLPNQKYTLRQRDIIKFGKQKVKVREIVEKQSKNSNNQIETVKQIKTNNKIYDDIRQHDKDQANQIHDIVSIKTDNQPTCRICLQPGEQTNPLICACKCTGSIRYLHLSCLKIWLGKQLNVVKTKYVICIKWNAMQCQMCKAHYKYRIYLDNKKYYTVQIPKPPRPYIVFQITKKNTGSQKIFYFISMAQVSKLSIGRKKQVDIKISDDVSVSRHHANLIYDFEDKKFLIQDNKSKFGTEILVKKNVLINPLQRGTSIQLGGQIFIFQTHRGEGGFQGYKDQSTFIDYVEKGEKQISIQSQDNDQLESEQQIQNNNPPINLVSANSIPNHSTGVVENLERSQNIERQPQTQARASLVMIQNLDD